MQHVGSGKVLGMARDITAYILAFLAGFLVRTAWSWWQRSRRPDPSEGDTLRMDIKDTHNS